MGLRVPAAREAKAATPGAPRTREERRCAQFPGWLVVRRETGQVEDYVPLCREYAELPAYAEMTEQGYRRSPWDLLRVAGPRESQ